MNGFHRFPRRLSAVLLVSLGAGAAQAQLNDTGQDKCYDGTKLDTCTNGNTGDGAAYPRQDARFGRDAAAAKGVLPKTGGGAAGFDFTKVCMSGELAGQGSCPTNPPLGTGPNDWACTKDNVTNLIWSLESVGSDWDYATITYPAAMNATNRCGYNTGWRAPTTRELLSIVHNGKDSNWTNPAIDTDYFPNTSGSVYWSVDTCEGDLDMCYCREPLPRPGWPFYFLCMAWGVAFYDGEAYVEYKWAPAGGARLVHSRVPSPPGAEFTDNLDGTVTDTVTGLTWDRCTWGQTDADCSSGSASTYNWQAALGVAVTANAMNSGAGYKGHNDWRLPGKNELESLVDRSRFNPAIDTTAFPNTPGYYYWSSTTYAPDPAYAWFVDFSNGVTGSYSGASVKANDNHVRLVRSGQSFDPSDLLGSLITANASPAGGGKVSCAPNPVPYGGTSTCTATPNAGYYFAKWSGACTGTGACVLSNVTAPKSVTANFVLLTPIPTPAVGLWGLGLLAGLLAGLGGFQMRRARRVRR